MDLSGCGKTLVARALANSCNIGGKRVSFFMRKVRSCGLQRLLRRPRDGCSRYGACVWVGVQGADCLSKWVGEAERQLRLLFDQVRRL